MINLFRNLLSVKVKNVDCQTRNARLTDGAVSRDYFYSWAKQRYVVVVARSGSAILMRVSGDVSYRCVLAIFAKKQ